MANLFLTITHIQAVKGWSYRNAQREMKFLKGFFGRNKKFQKITIREFCEYEGLEINEFENAINEYYGKR